MEKEKADLSKKLDGKVSLKRKADEIDSLKKLKSQEINHSSIAAPAPMTGLQDERVPDNMVVRDINGSTVPINISGSGYACHINSYPAASAMLHGSSSATLPENVTATMSGRGSGASMHGTGGVPPMASFFRAHVEMLFDRAGQVMHNNGPPYAGHRDMSFNDKVSGQSFVAYPTSMGINGIFGPSMTIESFPGMPNSPSIDAANQSSASDLYQFADAVFGR